MPFTPAPLKTTAGLVAGRYLRLGAKDATLASAPTDETQAALFASPYRGEKRLPLCLGAATDRLVPASCGAIVVAVESPTHLSALFLWRAASGGIAATLCKGVPVKLFVSQRGAPRLPGEPKPGATGADAGATGDVQPAPAKAPAKAATSQPAVVTQPDVADALETLRQALQPKATVDEDAVRAIVEEMLQSPQGQTLRTRRAVAQAAHTNPILDALYKRYAPGQEAPANLLLAAPPSLGKSFAVREFGKQYDLYLEHGCTDDLDEVATLLGGPVPDGNGGFLVVDGVLTQAVRAGAQGQTVLLLLDEVLRLGDRPQEWLLSFLTGVKTSAGRVYRLRTRRADSGNLEVIECPTANLHLVAAANLGARHPQEAFWSRWDVVRFGFDASTVEGIVRTVAESYGIADADTVAKRYTAAVVVSRAEVSANTLRYPLDVRTIERACQLATLPTAGAVLAFAASRVVDTCAHWSIDLGETDGASLPACDNIAKILTGSL